MLAAFISLWMTFVVCKNARPRATPTAIFTLSCQGSGWKPVPAHVEKVDSSLKLTRTRDINLASLMSWHRKITKNWKEHNYLHCHWISVSILYDLEGRMSMILEDPVHWLFYWTYLILASYTLDVHRTDILEWSVPWNRIAVIGLP